MEYLAKAALDPKIWRNYIVKISLVGTVSLAGFILALLSLVSGRILFAFWYLVAFCLGLGYLVIRINTILPTFIAADSEKLVMSTWKNGVFPYQVGEKNSFFSDFIPEKVQTYMINFSDVEKVFIGSKRFMKKVLPEEEYPKVLKELEVDKGTDNILKKMDFVLVTSKSGETLFMSVTDFDVKSMCEVVDIIERNCQGVKIQLHLPKLVRMKNRLSMK